MEMSDGSGRLIPEWENNGMEEDYDYCCERAAGLHGRDAAIENLRQREIRLQRMGHFLAAGLLVLISVSVALLVITVQGRRPQSSESKHMVHSYSNSSGINMEQQTYHENPSAMLTAPKVKNTTGKYLQWESRDGHSFLRGGFSYSNGSLKVPKDGYYRVFLQITFERRDEPHCEFRLTNMVYVFRETYKNDWPLLSSVDTVQCTVDEWSKTLYTSGLFHLDANSQLRVTSSHSHLIAEKEFQVFFGAELLLSNPV